MDHLPSVSHAAIPTLKIPYLDGDPKFASSNNFSDFPVENQWTFNELEWPVRSDESKTSRQEISSFLQAWLFFEALRHVLIAVHVTFRKEDFILREHAGCLVTTRELPRVLREWKERDQLVDQDERLLCQEAVLKVLKRAYQVISGNLFRTDTPEALRPLDDSQRLAICVLHETLQHAYCEIWRAGNAEVQRPSLLAPQSMLPRANMTCLGWCPSDVAQVYEIFDNTTLYFSSLLGRYDLGLDHFSCSAKQCLARHVDENSYKTRHRADGCTCDYITVDNDEVLPILRRGEIPRVVIANGGEEYRLRVHNSGSYVAISHVWSDGLGNVKGNSLPACQLKHIQEIAAACWPEIISGNTSSSIAIWIDTLCVPLEQEGKRLALIQLHEVYQQADRVLVLDGELQRATLQSDLEERVVRICVSGWMRRLWTLEEGVIGRPKLTFQFLEGSMPLPLLMPSLHSTVGFNALRFLDHYLPSTSFWNTTWWLDSRFGTRGLM
jgi:Heterokaryon incompatibility protein (HET)